LSSVGTDPSRTTSQPLSIVSSAFLVDLEAFLDLEDFALFETGFLVIRGFLLEDPVTFSSGSEGFDSRLPLETFEKTGLIRH